MTGLEIFFVAAIVGWVMAAPDETTARTRGGVSGAARAGASAAKARAQQEWAAGGPVRAQRRTERRTRMAQTRKGRAGLWGERALIGTARAVRSGARIARAGVGAAPAGYRTGATRAVQRRADRKARRTAAQARAQRWFIDPAANPTAPAGTNPAGTNPAGADAGPDAGRTPVPSAIVDPAEVPVVGEPDPAQPEQPVSDFCPVCGGCGYIAEGAGAGALCPRCGGSGVTPIVQPDGPAGEPAGEVFDVPGVGRLTAAGGPPRTPYEATLDPEDLAKLRRLTAIREAGYTGGVDQDLQPVPDSPAAGGPARWSTGDVVSEADRARYPWQVTNERGELVGLYEDGTEAVGHARLCGGAVNGRPYYATESTDSTSSPTGPGEGSTQNAPATAAGATTTEITKENGMAEIGEFENTGDLRAEAAELEGIAEELAEALAEFNRRKQALEEKVGAAPFGTRAISEAAAALSDSQSLEESQEALTELRVAVDASDAVADVTAAHEAKGNVEAFAEA